MPPLECRTRIPRFPEAEDIEAADMGLKTAELLLRVGARVTPADQETGKISGANLRVDSGRRPARASTAPASTDRPFRLVDVSKSEVYSLSTWRTLAPRGGKKRGP